MTQINLNWPWGDMHDAFFLPDKVVTIRSCRRSFKTHGATRWLIERLLDEDTVNGLWVDTTQSNLDKYIDRYFRPVLGDAWSSCSFNSQKKILTLPNKKQIDFASAERPENLEGFEYSCVVLNEGGIILKKSGLWDNSIFPMTKPANNQTRIVGTPKGKNKFHELGIRHKNIHFTVYDCPFYTDEEIEVIKKSIPAEAFRQEYMAEFLEGAGSVFRNITQCIKDVQFKEKTKGEFMGVDLAKHQDFTVITIMDKDGHVGYMDRFNQIDWNFQKKRIFDTWVRFGKPKTMIDSTGVGDPILDDLKAAGMYNVKGYKYTNQTKTDLVQNLSVAMDNSEISFYKEDYLVSELEVFGYEVSKSGKVTYNAPDGLHDDAVNSIALCAIQKSKKTEFTFVSNY